MIDEHLLRNAIVLDEYRNFARAADALHISQPTLSRRIQTLESSIGERLFDRHARTITPTLAGEIVLKHARSIQASSRAMQEEISRYQGVLEGSLTIGSGPYVASGLLAPTINLFHKKYPNITIDTIVDIWSNLPDRMLRESFDFVLAEISELEDSQNFDLTELQPHPGFLYCRSGHPILERADIGLDDVAQFPLIAPVIPTRLANLFDSIPNSSENQDSAPRRWQRITANDQAMIKTLVFGGDGIAIGTFGTLAPEIETGIYATLPLRLPQLKSQYGIITRKGVSASPSSKAFIELLIENDLKSSALEMKFIESLVSPTKV